ncbi:hypothetical protein IRJ41_022847, partial [Triplophysa rosa]
ESTPSCKTRSEWSSSRSGSSSTNAAAAMARAKAEAAKACLMYADEEEKINVEKAKLEAKMDKMVLDRETAAAVAEAEALEAAVDTSVHSKQDPLETAPVDVMQRLSETLPPDDTIQPHTELSVKHSVPATHFKAESYSDDAEFDHMQQKRDSAQPSQFSPAMNHLPGNTQDDNQRRRHTRFTQSSTLPFPVTSPTLQPSQQDKKDISDFVRYFARRELVNTGLLQFNDQPESFRAWQRSFQNAVSGLNLTPSEELDLLVKWLGKESAEHAKRMRSVLINQPLKGLDMIWTRLEECYGAPEVIERALFKRIEHFPIISSKDFSKIHELSDLLMELESAKADGYLPGLSYLDTARGINPIVQKLPFNLQEKWLSHGSGYKERYGVSFPPFEILVDFISQQARIRNDPGFNFFSQTDAVHKADGASGKPSKSREVLVNKVNVSSPVHFDSDKDEQKAEDAERLCPIHKIPHLLRKCCSFREKPLEERFAFLKVKRICFRCCVATTHIAKNCTYVTQSSECGSEKHISALHPGPAPKAQEVASSSQHGGEDVSTPPTEVEAHCMEVCKVEAHCIEVCKGDLSNKSCSKISLVKVYPKGQPEKALKVYVILDEQSNRSLARSEFFDAFKENGPASLYTLRTCSGVTETVGQKASDYQIESEDGKVILSLPSLLECNNFPDNRIDIPTPSAALYHSHLKPIAPFIPDLDPDAAIMILLGRDIIRVHKVRRQVNGPHDAPYAQKLDLGWVIVGNVCLNGIHKSTTVSTFFTNTKEQRPSIFDPCPNVFHVKERNSNDWRNNDEMYSMEQLVYNHRGDQFGQEVFKVTCDDNKVAPSINDLAFLHIMEQELEKDESNRWIAPLPFKAPRCRLPNNRCQAMKRLSTLRRNLERNTEMKQHFFTFMGKVFSNNHAEEAPPLMEGEECWYLPLFGVYHPKKPGNIRVVFDSGARHEDVSLNDVLLSGPDLNNTLLGVLMRFRKEAVAITADIEQMFYCFLVREDDRNFLRFLWFRNNDLSADIIEYRMLVHVFGNSPSPAVAIYCLRQSIKGGDPEVKNFVNRDFYVDDGLKSLPTVEAAVDLLKNTQEDSCWLKTTVLKAFPPQDHASDLKDLDFGCDILPTQRTTDSKPFTRRGILSTINSIFYPLGFVAPVIIQGKLILRDFNNQNDNWDSPLPKEMEEKWDMWRLSLKDLSKLQIPRCYTNKSPSTATRRELFVFSDASIKAIAAVAYLRLTDSCGINHVGFIMGKAKLSPVQTLAEFIASEIDIPLDDTTYFTDSKVVLGYIYNESRRFYVYVSNRVLRIRKSSHPNQWKYVYTEENPADIATRSVTAARLQDTKWLHGPKFLQRPNPQTLPGENTYEFRDPSSDAEVRPQISTLKTTMMSTNLGAQRFSKFSTWKSITHAIARLLHISRQFHKGCSCKGWHYCSNAPTVEELSCAEKVIIKAIQQETYVQEYKNLETGDKISKKSILKGLDPFIDADGLLSVGGRLTEAQIGLEVKKTRIIPGKHHVATLLVKHHHQKGAVRAAGYWIVGGKRRVCSVIHECVTCRRLRKEPHTQKMADLPADRVSTDPPFMNVGLDVFCPWSVAAQRTRDGHAQSKRWAVIFTCMSVRAVHIELIESLDTSSFINALRRFLAIRGPVKLIRSDRGTNFVGACKELNISSNLDYTSVKRFLVDQGCIWQFNPPHASHMGGSWEMMIGLARRILDAMFQQLGPSALTHETLSTLMAEVAAIINAQPLVPVSSDPDDPFILTPNALLTQKITIAPAPVGDWVNDLHNRQWRRVQHLAQTFWDKWKKQYLHLLQPKRKWPSNRLDLELGSIDNKVCTVEVKFFKKEGPKVFIRPITMTILLLTPEKLD